jgi:hypothetical protein
MVEAIITALSRIRWLLVIAHPNVAVIAYGIMHLTNRRWVSIITAPTCGSHPNRRRAHESIAPPRADTPVDAGSHDTVMDIMDIPKPGP